jgi:hypothetical protein
VTPGGEATSMGLVKVSEPSAFSVMKLVEAGNSGGRVRVVFASRTSWASLAAARPSRAAHLIQEEKSGFMWCGKMRTPLAQNARNVPVTIRGVRARWMVG